MFRKQYLINIIETETEKSYSTYTSKIKMIFFSILLLTLLLIISIPLNKLLLKTSNQFKINQLKNENYLLRNKFNAWQTRTDSIVMYIKQLKKENKKISMLAVNSDSHFQYGVGGPEHSPSLENTQHPVLTRTELKLSNIEHQINHLSESMTDLKNNISSRMDKISHYPSIKPIRKGWISSPFGKRKDPFTNKIVDHPGIDICTKIGTKVVATGAGKIIAIRKIFIKNKGYGKFILIDHDFGYRTLYAHLSKVLVKKGQHVNRWDIIGLTGNTGKSTSPHIHYGVFYNSKPQDPFNFILE